MLRFMPCGAVILSAAMAFAGAVSPCPPDAPQDRFGYSSWWAAPGYWQRRIDLQRSVIEKARKPFDLVLVGDSITHNWEGWVDGTSKSNLLSWIAQGRISRAEAHVEPMRNWSLLTNEFSVLNLGISGDDTRNVIWRLTEGRSLEGYQARFFAVMIGTNNVLDAPEDVAKAVGKIVKLIVSSHPESTVLLHPIFPRGKMPDNPRRLANEAVNARLANLADGKRVVWCDFNARLVDGSGVLSAEMMSDGVHPCECGYAIWREELLRHLRKSVKLPGWAEAKISEAVARYKVWKGADETVAFTFMTDVHSRLSDANAAPDFANSRYHVLFAQAAAERAGCDFLVDAGDHDFEHQCHTADEAFRRMAMVRGLYEGCAARPVLFCLGNHDHGPVLKDSMQRPISSAQFGDALNVLAERNGFKVVFGANRSWGYYDAPKKKLRAIFCNTSDDGYYGFSQAQVDFVEQALKTLPEGWTAAAFSHFCVFDEIGHWKRYQRGGIKRKAEFMAVLENFAKARPHAFVGVFCGDSHFDNEMELRGVNWTISQGYGGVGVADKPWGARTVGFSRASDMIFELVAVKPKLGECRIFRVGAGGAAFDRGYVYFNEVPIK